MSYLQQYLQKNQRTAVNNFDTSGFDLLEKAYAEAKTGSVTSFTANGDITILQRVRNNYLRMLFSMSPSANQAAEKLVKCLKSDGWIVRPKSGKGSIKKAQKLADELVAMDLSGIIDHLGWGYLTFGDVFVYTPFGRGEKKDKAVELVPLDNLGVYLVVDRPTYEEYGVIKIKEFKYEIVPLEGSVGATSRKVITYPPENILRWTRKTAYNMLTGTAPLEEDQATLILGLKVLNHNLRFFANSAKPPLVVMLGEDSDYNKAVEYKKVLDSRYKGSNNMWETMVTWGGTDVKELTLPDTTAFYDMLTYVRIQVCGLLGVPPGEIGVVDKSGLNTAETGHKDFIKTNVNAWKRELSHFLTNELLKKRMGIDDMEIWLPPMDAISEKQRAETNRMMIESGQMTINESRESLGKDPVDEDWAKVLIYGNTKGPKSLVPLDGFIDHVSEAYGTSPTQDGVGQSRQDKPMNSGRPDLDGRINDVNDERN